MFVFKVPGGRVSLFPGRFKKYLVLNKTMYENLRANLGSEFHSKVQREVY